MQINKNIQLLIKILIIALSLSFIFFRVKTELKELDLNDIFKTTNNYWLLAISFILMFFNWGIETYKWQCLVNKLQKVSFANAYKAILSGVTVAIFTPNRIGEFGGRILALEKKNRVSGIFATLIGSYSQLLTTIIVGLCSLPFYIHFYPKSNDNTFINYKLLFWISGILSGAGLILFFNLKIIYKLVKKEKWLKFIAFIDTYSKKLLLKTLLLSMLRYFVFFNQFYLLLLFFNVDISWLHSLYGISIIYLITSIIPMLSFFEFGVGGSVTILVLGIYSPLTISLFSTSLILWIINLAIPALIGTIFLYKFRI